ncbi:DUF2508 family protein [Clostridium sp. WILCCON 0269]|uniref:DUF2508 family protein n=1 Tax=Candidatus Clostridium eludens TaxID=3381663 RepID=A0ABW8SQU8_9CLOT
MNKYSIVKHLLMKNSKYTPKQKKLLKDIEKAREELERCRIYFDAVKDPHLVDYAIYMEEATKARYMYLLNEMKKSRIELDDKNVFENLSHNRKSS